MEKEKTAVFIGHREIFEDTEQLTKRIKKEITILIQSGYEIFLNGGMGVFDSICARAVSDTKKSYPYIKNILVLPYIEYRCPFSELFDETLFPELLVTCPKRAAIPKRNRYMVDKSASAVCFVKYFFGGCGKTLEYARSKKLKIINTV